jgi:hypothetical protein
VSEPNTKQETQQPHDDRYIMPRKNQQETKEEEETSATLVASSHSSSSGRPTGYHTNSNNNKTTTVGVSSVRPRRNTIQRQWNKAPSYNTSLLAMTNDARRTTNEQPQKLPWVAANSSSNGNDCSGAYSSLDIRLDGREFKKADSFGCSSSVGSSKKKINNYYPPPLLLGSCGALEATLVDI